MKCQRCGKESDMGHGDIIPCKPSMSKPWEQEWRAEGCCWVERRDDVTSIAQVKVSGSVEEQAVYNRFLVAAPDMARAGLRAVEGVIRDTGLDDVDSVVQRGEPVRLTAEEFGALVDALRKAGVPL